MLLPFCLFLFQAAENFEDVHSQRLRGDSGPRCVMAGAVEGGVTPVALIKEQSGCR